MEGRVVIVTGGGTGIGRAAAAQFVKEGARVAVVGRRIETLTAVAPQSDHFAPIEADLTEAADVERVAQTVEARWGRIDVIVNNAGMFSQSPLGAIHQGLLAQLFATNVSAPTLLSQALLPQLKQNQGSIVNVSSTFGHKAAPLISLYAASKAALEHLTRCWALELAPLNIRVNAIAPGPTDTEIMANSGLPKDVIERVKLEEVRRIPLQRRGTANEVARWIVHLADPDASWVTGQVISIDGGLSVS